MTERTVATNMELALGPAKSLADAYKTLDPRPLVSPKQLSVFYKDTINRFRGEDLTTRMGLGLSRAWGGQHYKAFLMGHSGVGKSTRVNPPPQPATRRVKVSPNSL